MENHRREDIPSSLVSKIEKAKTYAEERERVSIATLSASFRGNHSSHQVTYDDGQWHCTCAFFPTHGLRSHIMALQRMMDGMLPRETATPGL